MRREFARQARLVLYVLLTAKFEPCYTFGYELIRRPFSNGRPG